MIDNKEYICIDFKSFFASVECVERNLDPFETNLVVADPSRGNGAICLAITPHMKGLGIRNRCRVFEIPKDLTYITALPRMKKYIEYASNIYAIYLKYIAKEDIHVYSIDEAFLDVTPYLKLYKMTSKQLAQKIIDDVRQTTGIPSSVGIGTNLFLAKIALDISSKKTKNSIAYLDEEMFKKNLWHHRPITDFWQIAKGTSKRLEKLGIYDLHGVAHCPEDVLYQEFGINAELLIDHAWGRESCTIQDIKAYKTKSNSISNSQILFEDYNYQDALLIVKEMVELKCLDLVSQELVTNSISLSVSYSKNIIKSTGGTRKMLQTTNSYKIIRDNFIELYHQTTDKNFPIRQIGIGFNNVVDEAYEQYNLFTDCEDQKKERSVQEAIIAIKDKYGKNAIIKGMNLEKKATTLKRNKLIGGHNSE